MHENQPRCKVPIGTAYQKPLSRDQTYEESFWQTQLLRDRQAKHREIAWSVISVALWAAMVAAFILFTP